MTVLYRESWTFEVDAHGAVEKAAQHIGGMPTGLLLDGSPWRYRVVRCDGCREFMVDGDYDRPIGFDSRDDLAEALADYEWTTDAEGVKHYCPHCPPLAAQGPDALRVPGPGQLRIIDGGA